MSQHQTAGIHIAKKTDIVSLVPQNVDTLVRGSAGSGKSRFYTVPEIGQCGGSFVVSDLHGMIAEECAPRLKENGYEIKILDLYEFKDGFFYNPFHYVRNDEDIRILVDCLMDNTHGPQESDMDTAFREAERNLLLAVFYYVYYEYKDNPKKQTIGEVMEILREISEETECSKITVPQPKRFAGLEKRDAEHAAVQYSKAFLRCTEDFLKQVLISANVRMVDFMNEKVQSLMKKDTLHLEELPGRKQALFISTNGMNTACNVISAMLYTQAVKIISEENRRKGAPGTETNVHIVLDGFGNTRYLPEIDKWMKEDNGICFSIIVQSLDQIYKIYGKEKGDSIVNSFENIVYMGTQCMADQEFIIKNLPPDMISATGEQSEKLVRNLPEENCIVISR